MTDYTGYFKQVDQHGVLHLAAAAMRLSQAYCGEPPAGNRWADPAGDVFPAGRPAHGYRTVCKVCAAAVSGEQPGEILAECPVCGHLGPHRVVRDEEVQLMLRCEQCGVAFMHAT